MAPHLEMAISANDASPQELANITRELSAWINSTAPGVEAAAPAPGAPRPGEKGAEIAIGALVLQLLNAGAITGLVNSLTTYLKERRPSVTIDLRDATGRSISLKADNVGRTAMADLVRQLDQVTRAPATAPTSAAAPAPAPETASH